MGQSQTPVTRQTARSSVKLYQKYVSRPGWIGRTSHKVPRAARIAKQDTFENEALEWHDKGQITSTEIVQHHPCYTTQLRIPVTVTGT